MMFTKNWLTVALAFVVVPLIGCGPEETPESTAQTAPPAGEADAFEVSPEPTPEPPPAELIVAGELESIDVDARTLTMNAPDGEEHAFAYTERTRFVGVSGPDELVSREGQTVTVYYSDEIGETELRTAEQVLLR